MRDIKCQFCGLAIGNSMVGTGAGLAHELCYYKSESERPRDEVVTELRASLAAVWKRARETQPCEVCRWPRPLDIEHNICECCGFQPGYGRSEFHEWDGEWWAKGIDRQPVIVERMERTIERLEAELDLHRQKGDYNRLPLGYQFGDAGK